jgi:hypothetical protein
VLSFICRWSASTILVAPALEEGQFVIWLPPYLMAQEERWRGISQTAETCFAIKIIEGVEAAIKIALGSMGSA